MSATTTRVEHALAATFHAKRVVNSDPEMFWVYSDTGARHAVDFGGDKPLCTCKTWTVREEFCEHIWYVLLTHPQTLDRITRSLQTTPTVCADGGTSTIETAEADETSTPLADRIRLSRAIIGHPHNRCEEFAHKHPVHAGTHYRVLATSLWGDYDQPTIVRWHLDTDTSDQDEWNRCYDDFTDRERSARLRQQAERIHGTGGDDQ